MEWWVIVLIVLAAGIFLPLLWRCVKPRPDVAGRTVFITGGSEGIGKCLANEFIKRGAHVILMARTESKLQSAVQELEGAKVKASQVVGYQAMDVTDIASVRKGIAEAVARFGKPFVLICCAGSATPGYFLDQDASVFERTMKLNYMGTVNVLKSVVPLMKDDGAGHIMIVASALAIVSFIGYASYSPTKHALRGLADTLRSELIGFGIKVSICYPPDTDTPGYLEELKSKPPETIACVPGSAFPPEQVARSSVSSMLLGDYHIQSVDFLQNILVSTMAGVTPRSFPFIEILTSPLMELTLMPFVWWFDFQARKYARKLTTGPSSGSGISTAAASGGGEVLLAGRT